ncbi:MAG: isoprenylcysteine carboxylmethyltransferase family protein [Terriglobales bacterium]|jgi:protein-S-isoprenylcysteine O-methyltransferase Ste14
MTLPPGISDAESRPTVLRQSWSQVARRIRVPLGFAFAGFYLWQARPVWYALLAGLAIAGAGLVLRAAASGIVQKNSELATSGPYAYTRNPLYLGSMIIGAGFAVAARSVWVFIGLLAFFLLIYFPVIKAEERFLRSRFPEFDAYAQQVPRFGIRLNPSSNRSGQFSSKLYRQHREYNALIGAVLMMVALAVKMIWLKAGLR